jgi:type II secretory pathway component PulC
VFACLLAFAGFHAGRFGSAIVFPTTASVSGGAATTREFDDAPRPDGTPQKTNVAAIFGTPEPTAAPATVAQPIAPSTSYGLRGITVVGNSRWAMLTADGANMLVRMGDKLADGEVVKEITPTAVLLSRDGALTILEFSGSSEENATDRRPDLTADFNPTTAPPEPPRVTTVTPVKRPAPPETELIQQPPLNIQTLRRAIYAPIALSTVHFVRARTYSGGIGWKLKWIKDSPLVEAAGLQRGDILVSINGQSVEDSDALQSLVLGLGKLDTIEIEYERGKRPMRATIPLIKS